MARTRYFDYKSSDSTLLLNEWRRGILRPGVYFGFNAVPGSGGLAVSLTMDSDPDKTGSVLGTIITRDGVVIQETTNLTDVATATAADPVNPRIDSLVATYIYNASLPSNDVTYEIVAGTPAANPSPPTLNDNQLLIANIHVAALQVTLAAGDIWDVNRLNLYASSVAPTLENLLRPGVYTGFLCKDGTAANQTTVEGGTFLSQELQRINQAATQTDLFTHSNTSTASHYRYDWIVAMHKYEDLETNPTDVDYVIVEGVEADESASAVAAIPSDSAILTAAQAVDPKYTSATYINKLALVRVQGSGGTMSKEFTHTPRLLLDTAWYVSGGTITQATQPVGPAVQYFPHQGVDGLKRALDLLQALVGNFYSDLETINPTYAPIKLWVEGDFHVDPDTLISIPSFVEIEGIGNARIRQLDAAHPTVSFGFAGDQVGMGGSIDETLATDQTGVPGGYERWEVDFDVSASLGSFANLSDYLAQTRFAGDADAGDIAFVDDNGTLRVGWFESYTTADLPDAGDSIRLILPTATTGPFRRVHIFKQRAGLKNVAIEAVSPATGRNYLSMLACKDCRIENVVAPAVEVSLLNEGTVIDGLDVVGGFGSWETPDYPIWSVYTPVGRNVYDRIYCRPSVGSSQVYDFGYTSSGGILEYFAKVGSVVVDCQDVPAVTSITFGWAESVIDSIESLDHNVDTILYCDGCFVGRAARRNPQGVGSANGIACLGDNSVYGVIDMNDVTSPDFTWGLGVGNTYVSLLGDPTVLYSSYTQRKNYCVGPQHVTSDEEVGGATLQADEDRNLALVTDATLTWSSGSLSFDDDIVIEMPYDLGTRTILQANSPIALADGERIYIPLTRSNAGNINVTPTTVSGTTPLRGARRNRDELIVVRRVGTKLYWMNGTVFDDGFSGALNNAAPFDGSVTYAKLATDAKEYVNESLEHWFGNYDDYDLPQDGILDLRSSLVTSYTASTGILLLDGSVSTGDIDNVQPGDTFIDNLGQRFPIHEVDSASRTLQLDFGLSVNVGAHGFVVRGNVAFWNEDLVGWTFARTGATTGQITYSSAVDLLGVRVGFLWLDSDGNAFRIDSYSDGADTIDIVGAFKTPVSGSPTSGLHGGVVPDNNPRNLKLQDLRPQYGTEVLAFNGVGRMEEEELAQRVSSDYSYTHFHVVPRDKRVVVVNPDATEISQIDAIFKPYEIVVTGWMNSFALLLSNVTEPGGSLVAFLDGEDIASASEIVAEGSTRRHYGSSGLWWSDDKLRNMPYGIHTVRVQFGTPASIQLTGCVFGNKPTLGSTRLFFDSPGSLFADNKRTDFELDSNAVPLSTSLGTSRGGKLVRYAKLDGTLAWAQTSLTEISATGTASTVSPTITGMSSTSGFRIGDLVRLKYAASPHGKHRITAINPGVSIDVTPNPGKNGAATIQYIGKTSGRTLDTSQLTDMYHENEVVSHILPVHAINTFGIPNGGSGLDDTLDDLFSDDSSLNNTWRAQPAGDGLHHMMMQANPSFADLAPNVQLTASATTIRIAFVGTGIDVISPNGWGGATAELDGVATGAVFTDHIGMARYPIAEDLDYGTHVLEIVRTSGTIDILGFAIYEPKEPTYTGYPIWKSCYLADYLDDLPVTEDLGVPTGLIQVDPVQTIWGDNNAGAAINVDPGFGNDADVDSAHPLGRALEFNTLDTATASVFYFVGYGSQVMVDLLAVTNNVNVTPEFLDHDGTWKAPASIAGVSVSGVSGAQVVTAGSRLRLTWGLSNSFDDKEDNLFFLRLSAVGAAGTPSLQVLRAAYATRFHTNQFRENSLGYSNMLYTPGGRDFRNVKAYELPKVSTPVSNRYYSTVPTITVGTALCTARVYSRGEYFNLRFSGVLRLLAANTAEYVGLVFNVDGDYISDTDRSPIVATTANDYCPITMEHSVYLSRGYHIVKLDVTNITIGHIDTVEIKFTGTPTLSTNNPSEVRKATPSFFPERSTEDQVV